jgi:hypothetical protein
MIPKMVDVGGDRVNTIALTIVVFTTAAPRGRDRPLDVTLGDILSYLQADLEKESMCGIPLSLTRYPP